ncbi:polyprenol phosphomannose-dependent alpha 1,6 mannosyltransferase MptB [Micromonospora sp. HM5-17]|uniref:polyprenol phosphomannose-dependent alpha 1,6 mannosyltransferase MptB n=1 Tax=Micromonospora sp. HM5-17 TaxID=2487710 RepID=UPI000F4719FC|nr:polyprenol phosphomannose-dependent alpha 1,6 mannosyltransferase MptB [Micromonospora sp. HM5-17]ROT31263.1 DUF2029 domain-containing protein [Micromonospora sp. HM5-17]
MPARERLTRLRTAGLAATTLMTAGAYGAGALPYADPDAAVPTAGTDGVWAYRLGLAGWLAGLVLLAATWWRLGTRLAALPPGAVAPRQVLGTGLLWAAPLLFAPPTASRDVYAYACQGTLWLDGVDPYATGVGPGGCGWAETVPALWRETPTPYGPLAVALSGVAVAVARTVATDPDVQLVITIALLRAEALAGLLLAAGAAPRLARSCGVDPVRAVWLGLLSPLIMIHAVGGAHHDALLLGLVLAALTLAAGPAGAVRGLVAGAAAGLAVAVKVSALVALPFVVLLGALRLSPETEPDGTGAGRTGAARVGTIGAVAGHAGAVLAGGSLGFAGVSVATRLDLGWLGALAGPGRLVQWTSLPTGLGMAAGYLLRLLGRPGAVDPAVTLARLLGLVALVVILAGLVVRAVLVVRVGLAAARRERVVTAGLAFAALALLSPIFYPWYALVAVAVLAAGLTDPRWTRRVAGLVVLTSFLVLPDGLGVAVLTKLPGALLDVALLVALAVLAVRRVGGGRGGRSDRPDVR